VWLEQHGCDAVIAQGIEAGGHRGMFLTTDLATQKETLALVSQCAAAVGIPVIAAGGIADAHGIARAMSLGAAAVLLGTVYLPCRQSGASAVHRRAIESANADATVVTNLFTGRPARGIVNRLIRDLGPLRDDLPTFPHAASALAPLRAHAEARGLGDFSPLWAGRAVSGARHGDAEELTRTLADESKALLGGRGPP